MKHAILAITCLAICGCETIRNEDGTTTTRFDAKAATDAVNAGFQTYDRYQRQSYIVGYDALGNPIYRAQ